MSLTNKLHQNSSGTNVSLTNINFLVEGFYNEDEWALTNLNDHLTLSRHSIEIQRNSHSDDHEYIWIDTCCIDKSSSAKLSEAINSMYRYYRKIKVCYAYLLDVRSDLHSRSFNMNFRMCKWFTRGWTLQELIVPTTVLFYTKDWNKIGTKASMQETISEITGIPSKVLLSQDDPSDSSIAARMSWAAGRETTCIEDRAYLLMVRSVGKPASV
ncbi:hypothetical protein BDP27DRAFT_1379145 [Rhodocollybia butyracea]|uniref:Heterokaryon incompatibility domain-containing protein n=1 Tax=Rhodocollybia butyracea TaxID=206335 RepID=A0A9P5QBF9_9AGAR|nr:hypothetical protein BDP27DRAFT_1379145 [Rhodocollybia butyracea]